MKCVYWAGPLRARDVSSGEVTRGYFGKVRQIPAADLRTLFASVAWLPLFSLGLRTLGLARFHAWVKRAPVSLKAGMSPEEIKSLGLLVNLAARRSPFRASCLTRSMLLEWLLRRRGITGQLRIGVSLGAGALSAHAWVEVEGEPVNDRPDIAQQFAPFDSVTPAAAHHAR